jgi:hypothetical protein
LSSTVEINILGSAHKNSSYIGFGEIKMGNKIVEIVINIIKSGFD